MHPILVQLGGLTLYTYGLIMAVGFIIPYFYILYLARATGQEEDFYSDIFFWIMVCGIVGAKLLYIIVDWQGVTGDLSYKNIVGCLRGGLVWYGGLIADIAFIYYYCSRRKKDVLQVLDTFSSPVSVGLAIGRWGCLMAGCCYGKPTNLPWAIVYPSAPILHPMAGIPVHPSPIYESLGSFLIALACYFVFRKSNKKGVAAALVLTLYAPLRFFLEFLRGDVERGVYASGHISTSQLVSALIFFPALLFLIRQLRQPAAAPEPEPKKGKKAKQKKGKSK
jgi:phosphatidylglycerol---prolipoprotein diacylglyceryl transferase